MNTLAARRRHPWAAVVVLIFALGLTGGLYAVFSPASKADTSTSSDSLALGKKLYAQSCSSCHGPNAEGIKGTAPSLLGVGAASVDFQVGTGRMPAQQPGPQVLKHPPIFDAAQTEALAAYVASLSPGPAIPDASQYSTTDADQAEGGRLFRTNCAACHNAVGKGGALSNGAFAPDLSQSSPKTIYEAMLTGPQNMPVFDNQLMPEKQKQDIIAFLQGVRTEPNPGGLGLGKVGPVSEGLFGWIVGIGALVAVALWLAARTAKARTQDHS